MEKRERKSYRTHALPFLLGICLLCTQLLTVHAATNPTATGESGTNGSGGGGGVVGGVAGEAILHSHVDGCYKDLSYSPSFGSWDGKVDGFDCYADSNTKTSGYAHTKDDDPRHVIRVGWASYGYSDGTLWNLSGYSGLATNGNTQLNVSVHTNSWGSTDGLSLSKSKYKLMNQNGVTIAQGSFQSIISSSGSSGSSGSSWENPDGSWGGSPDVRDFYGTFHFKLPEGTTRIYLYLDFYHNAYSAWFTSEITGLSFSGGAEKLCKFEEGDVEYSKASFGGTSDASVTDTINKTVLNTTQKDITGNGIFQMHVVNGNLLNGVDNTTYLNNAAIRDMEIPNALENVTMSDAANTRTVTWEVPKSNGTEYEFKAQTYAVDFDSPTGTTLVMDTELNGTNQTVHNHIHQGNIVFVDGIAMVTESGGCYTVPYTIENVTYYKLNH